MKENITTFSVLLDDITYTAEFRSPTIEECKDYFNNTNIYERDAQLAKRCFVSGDKEMVNFEESFIALRLLQSYSHLLANLFNYQIVDFKYIKDEHIFTVNIDDKITEKTYKGTFSEPSFKTMKSVMSKMYSGQVFEAEYDLAIKCFVDGDKELLKHTAYPQLFLSYKSYMSTIFNLGDAEVKKK